MLRFLDRHKFGLLGTVIFHFLLFFVATYSHMPVAENEFETVLTVIFPELEQPSKEPVSESLVPSNNHSNKGVNEAAPSDISKGDYNAYNQEPSESSKELFEEQLANELKALEQEVIQEQRDAGYGYTEEETAELLDAKKNMELESVVAQKPRSESVFEGKTNITYKLENRFDTFLKVPVYMCQYGGKVVINIAVNRNGNVISSQIDKESTQATDACLLSAALKSAKNTKFNKKPSAPKTQVGSITYIFIEQ